MEAFYDPARKCYWIPNNRSEMIEITETSLVRHLASAGFVNDRDKRETALDDELNRIQVRGEVDACARKARRVGRS